MKECPMCKHANHDTDFFCRECGSPLNMPGKEFVWVGTKGPEMRDGPGSSMIFSDLSEGAGECVSYRFNCPGCSACTTVKLHLDLSNLPLKYTCTCGKELEILLSPVLRAGGSCSILPEKTD